MTMKDNTSHFAGVKEALAADKDPANLDDDFEIEVVDENEEQVQEAATIPEDVVDLTSADPADPDADLADVADKTKKRIQKLRFETHSAIAERDAERKAKQELVAQNRKLQEQLNQQRAFISRNNVTTATNMRESREAKINNLKREMADANKSGEFDKAADVQAEIAKLQSEVTTIQQHEQAYKQQANQPVQQPQPQQAQPQAQPQQSQVLDPYTDAWIRRNPWFGNTDGTPQDKAKTAEALRVNNLLVSKGIDPSDPKFYSTVDYYMNQFDSNGQEQTLGDTRQAPASVAPVAAGGGVKPSKKQRKVRLSSDEVALAKRLGITPKAYAEQKKLRYGD